jgi:hypothetical protein
MTQQSSAVRRTISTPQQPERPSLYQSTIDSVSFLQGTPTTLSFRLIVGGL